MNKEETSLGEVSTKLDILIALLMKGFEDTDFDKTKRKLGVAGAANYLADFGLDAAAIAKITGSPVSSIRTLLTPTRRKK